MKNKRKKKATTLCENFCIYYKPGKNEDLACEGFAVVHRLIEHGKKIHLAKRTDIIPGRATVDALRSNVCRICSFHAGDCDYILTGGKAAPCGGFVLLSHLLEGGEITAEELKSPDQ